MRLSCDGIARERTREKEKEGQTALSAAALLPLRCGTLIVLALLIGISFTDDGIHIRRSEMRGDNLALWLSRIVLAQHYACLVPT